MVQYYGDGWVLDAAILPHGNFSLVDILGP